MSRKSRPATEEDVSNVAAWALLKLAGRSDQGRQALRSLPPIVQEDLHTRAAAERERQAYGPTLT
ncbi:hypothetical protein [Phytohabitans aurantiacus]|uniref:Uncharacterized protein n=1 Tax=Phytohabitans aurantiacus TaxID=3016789 RepID=A0ABQ5QRC5_9ACTN|nr:hypothetical protein [Phytohabitans aurantiacus]GLH97138.1 hypothetical protein Pa4123_24130 [Phytohabitans aurantiacus]